MASKSNKNTSAVLVTKYTSTSVSIITRDIAKLNEPTGNIYESVSIISKRAYQIATSLKEELSGKLVEFSSSVDNLEEIRENREQIEISRFYERMPKPTSIATDEFLEGKLTFRRKKKD
jgi:DNA-directed RNA polymerase subunit K/omega